MHEVRCLRCRCADRLPVPLLRRPQVTSARDRVAEALRVLGLLARAAPGDARARFRAALRAQGIAERGDPLGDGLPRAWARPDLYGASFARVVLGTLGGEEWALAVASLTVLSGRPPRQARQRQQEATDARPASDPGAPGHGGRTRRP